MKLCAVETCDATATYREWCRLHWQRWYRTGDPLGHRGKGGGVLKPGSPPPGSPCLADGCELPSIKRGCCQTHYQRLRIHGDPNKVLPNAGGRPRLIPFGPARAAWMGNYVGDRASYTAMHNRVRNTKGSASKQTCCFCLRQAEQWAYDHADESERWVVSDHYVDAGVRYSLEIEHYMPLCRSCHVSFDKQRVARERNEGKL